MLRPLFSVSCTWHVFLWVCSLFIYLFFWVGVVETCFRMFLIGADPSLCNTSTQYSYSRIFADSWWHPGVCKKCPYPILWQPKDFGTISPSCYAVDVFFLKFTFFLLLKTIILRFYYFHKQSFLNNPLFFPLHFALVLCLLLNRITLKSALTVAFSKLCCYAPSFEPLVSSLPVNSLLLFPVFFFFPNLLTSPNCHPYTSVNHLLVPQFTFCYSSTSSFAFYFLFFYFCILLYISVPSVSPYLSPRILISEFTCLYTCLVGNQRTCTQFVNHPRMLFFLVNLFDWLQKWCRIVKV